MRWPGPEGCVCGKDGRINHTMDNLTPDGAMPPATNVAVPTTKPKRPRKRKPKPSPVVLPLFGWAEETFGLQQPLAPQIEPPTNDTSCSSTDSGPDVTPSQEPNPNGTSSERSDG
jgi:hypothetical protein